MGAVEVPTQDLLKPLLEGGESSVATKTPGAAMHSQTTFTQAESKFTTCKKASLLSFFFPPSFCSILIQAKVPGQQVVQQMYKPVINLMSACQSSCTVLFLALAPLMQMLCH